MTLPRFLPGQVVVFGTSALRWKFEETYLSAFGELVESRGYQLKSGQYWLELFVVNNGEELRFLEMARSQPGVSVASLNYIGFGLSDTSNVAPVPELLYQPGAPPERGYHCLLLDESQVSIRSEIDTFDQLARRVETDHKDFLIAAIDVCPKHALKVMEVIAEGLHCGRSETDSSLLSAGSAYICALTSDLDDSTMTDLFRFVGRLLDLAKLVGPSHNALTKVLSITMSVDFSQIIRGYGNLDAASDESPNTVFSFPLFEHVLSKVVDDLAISDDKFIGAPAVFAAAGNRVSPGGPVRVRLGYPATRPETIAASFVTADPVSTSLVQPADSVDVPATTALKPCFAIDTKDVASISHDGSSFASAWLAGYYSGLVSRQRKARSKIRKNDVRCFGLLSKLAWLMQRTERRRLPSGQHRLPCFAAVFRGNAQTNGYSPWDMDELIASLWKEYKADICLHGSTAAVGEWLRLNKRHIADIDPLNRKDLGDVDLVYDGHISDNAVEGVKEFVRNWFNERLGRSWVVDRKRPVELHAYEGLVNAAERLSSVTPAAKLYITRGGIIDTWGGLDDLQRGEIRFFPLTHIEFWKRNKLFSSGADCLGLNIVHWVGLITLLQVVSRAVGIAGPKADPESLKQLRSFLDRVDNGSEPIPLFGYRTRDLRERVDRRFERVETLMGSCARLNIVDEELDTLVKRLCDLRRQTEQLGRREFDSFGGTLPSLRDRTVRGKPWRPD